MDVVDNGAKAWVKLNWLFRQKGAILSDTILSSSTYYDIFILVLTASDISLFTIVKICEYIFYFETNSSHPNNMKNVMITNTLLR